MKLCSGGVWRKRKKKEFRKEGVAGIVKENVARSIRRKIIKHTGKKMKGVDLEGGKRKTGLGGKTSNPE